MAPVEIWIPFCAMYGVAPAPVTVLFAMNAVEPAPSAVMPFFW